jgi:hypothetical protein
MVPVLSYIIFYVDFIQLAVFNLTNVVLFAIQFAMNGDKHEETEERHAVIACSYLVLIVGITVICATIGLWHDRAQR